MKAHNVFNYLLVIRSDSVSFAPMLWHRQRRNEKYKIQ